MEKKSLGLLELETAVLECFLEKTPLSPLGVKVTGYHILKAGSPPLICFKKRKRKRSWLPHFVRMLYLHN
jgi:hypothetical protein